MFLCGRYCIRMWVFDQNAKKYMYINISISNLSNRIHVWGKIDEKTNCQLLLSLATPGAFTTYWPFTSNCPFQIIPLLNNNIDPKLYQPLKQESKNQGTHSTRPSPLAITHTPPLLTTGIAWDNIETTQWLLAECTFALCAAYGL